MQLSSNNSRDIKLLTPKFIRPLTTVCAALALSQNCFSQSSIESLTLVGQAVAKGYNHRATPNYIPVCFAYAAPDQAKWKFPNQPVRDYAELNIQSIRSQLEIRGDLARSLYQQNVRLVLIETDPRKDKIDTTAGTGLVFIENQNGSYDTKQFKISPFAFDRRGGKVYPNGKREWNLEYFMIVGEPTVNTQDAITRIGSEMKSVVADTMNIPSDQRDSTPKNNFDDSQFFSHLTSPLAPYELKYRDKDRERFCIS